MLLPSMLQDNLYNKAYLSYKCYFSNKTNLALLVYILLNNFLLEYIHHIIINIILFI